VHEACNYLYNELRIRPYGSGMFTNVAELVERLHEEGIPTRHYSILLEGGAPENDTIVLAKMPRYWEV
jgi:hypothetical protein